MCEVFCFGDLDYSRSSHKAQSVVLNPYSNMLRVSTLCATVLSLAALVSGANQYTTDQLQNGMKFIIP